MRSFNLDDMGYPLLVSALGAPVIYLIFGFAVGGRSTIVGFDMAVVIVAFATGYAFSVVITGIFFLVTLLAAAYFAFSQRTTWWLIASWPVALGLAAGLAYAPFTGGMVLAMGAANALLLRLLRRSKRTDGGESQSGSGK